MLVCNRAWVLFDWLVLWEMSLCELSQAGATKIILRSSCLMGYSLYSVLVM